MYWIKRLRSGRYACSYRVQDGTEHFEADTREQAIARMVRAARMDQNIITEADIHFSREVEVEVPARRDVQVVADSPVSVPELERSVPPTEDAGPAKYPPGLKGWLLWVAGKL